MDIPIIRRWTHVLKNMTDFLNTGLSELFILASIILVVLIFFQAKRRGLSTSQKVLWGLYGFFFLMFAIKMNVPALWRIRPLINFLNQLYPMDAYNVESGQKIIWTLFSVFLYYGTVFKILFCIISLGLRNQSRIGDRSLYLWGAILSFLPILIPFVFSLLPRSVFSGAQSQYGNALYVILWCLSLCLAPVLVLIALRKEPVKQVSL